MERGKERAELRSAEMKRLLMELENTRDRLLDEVAHKQGEAYAMEATIKRLHQLILDINKDEQTALEMERIDREKQAALAQRAEDNAKAKEENAPRRKKVEKALKGVKNSGRTKEIQERARSARGKKRAKKADEE